MTTIAATEAKNRFGELLESVHREPVEILKKGRAVAVVLSIQDYKEMQLKLSRGERKTDFTGIDAWIKKNASSGTDSTLDQDDYQQHLDEKYGS